MIASRVLLSALEGELPTEFRLFRAGENPTSKGVFLFDAQAAARVMAAYRQAGTDVMIDLEHLSLDDPASTPRTDTSDARGWCALEVRNGELWAANVRWTPDGAERLSKKTQRYVSPAFLTDEGGRILEVINVALVAMPATHSAQALVAASALRRAKDKRLIALAILAAALARTAPKNNPGARRQARHTKRASVKTQGT